MKAYWNGNIIPISLPGSQIKHDIHYLRLYFPIKKTALLWGAAI